MSRWLTIDPGETVGWAIWEGDELEDCGQTPMWEFADTLGNTCLATFRDLPGEREPNFGSPFNFIVSEDFAIYPPGVGPGPPPPWDKVLTARLIGAIQFICREAGIPFYEQPASIKAQAVMAGAEDLFLTPRHENRHANDAIMHGVYHSVTQGVGKGGGD